jgi:RHS repeat-associated protein
MVFVGWAGACTGTTQPCSVTMNGATSVVAHFASPLEFYHLDVLGSVRMVTNAAGAVVKRHDYFAFGEDIMGPEGDPRRFTGKERDAETELHYFGARYYRSVWGRFTSPDPGQASGSPQDPQGWNAYAYARNNPLRLDNVGVVLDVGDDVFRRFGGDPGVQFEGGPLQGVIKLQIGGEWVTVGGYQYYNKLDQLFADIGRRAKGAATIGTAFLEATAIGIAIAFPITGLASDCVVSGGCFGGAGSAAAMPPTVRRKLGGVLAVANSTAREVIIMRGGGGRQVQRVATHLQDKTIREVAELAAKGDPGAISAIKVAKEASRLAQKGGG